MLIYDEPLLSGQPPLSGHSPTEGSRLMEVQLCYKSYLTCFNLMFKPTLLNLYRLACKIRIVICSNVCESGIFVSPHKLYSPGRF